MKINRFSCILKVTEDFDPHPDPLVRGTVPRIQNVTDPEHWTISFSDTTCGRSRSALRKVAVKKNEEFV
jgi:hypothetical protein